VAASEAVEPHLVDQYVLSRGHLLLLDPPGALHIEAVEVAALLAAEISLDAPHCAEDVVDIGVHLYGVLAFEVEGEEADVVVNVELEYGL